MREKKLKPSFYWPGKGKLNNRQGFGMRVDWIVRLYISFQASLVTFCFLRFVKKLPWLL